MRPTGKLHLGNYVGALESWVKFQEEYQNYHMVANWHALTTSYENVGSFHRDTIDMVIDWIAAGIDPQKSVIFVQSDIIEHAELHLLFSMLITLARLERNPTVKEQIRELHLEENVSYGHLGYPVLQAADILIYKANLVPVGEDQVPHIEITREIARRFNFLYGEVFPEPEASLTQFARFPGLNGNRMSKSVGNTILLSDSPAEIKSKIMLAVTDPQKVYLTDKGHPDVCNVFVYHQKFNSGEISRIREDCENARLGCVVCKENLAEKLILSFAKFRQKRQELEENEKKVEEILAEGAEKARKAARATMAEVRNVMRVR
jgi:tryptophanyl-tRNA synthetase